MILDYIKGTLSDWFNLLIWQEATEITLKEIVSQQDWVRLLRLVGLTTAFAAIVAGFALEMAFDNIPKILFNRSVVLVLLSSVILAIIYGLFARFCKIKIPKANSIPIKILENQGAKNSENPSGYNCFTSKVEIAK